MALSRRPGERFTANLRILTTAGISPPKEISEVRERFEAFRRSVFEHGALEQVIATLTAGKDVDPLMWAAAVADVSTNDQAKNDALDRVRASVTKHLADLYRPVALSNYRAVASKFDAAAKHFVTAVSVVDPNTDAALVVSMSDTERKAWQQAELHAAELDRILPALRAAAELAGHNLTDIELTVDPGDLDSKTIEDCWDISAAESHNANMLRQGFTVTVTNTRCGRWSALHTAGAAIRALPLP